MYLIIFSIKDKTYEMVIDKKRHNKTIKKIFADKLWKKFRHCDDSRQAIDQITITNKLPFECPGCSRPVKLEAFLRNKTISCQKCFETSYLPFYYDLMARTPDYRIIHDGDGVFIISQ